MTRPLETAPTSRVNPDNDRISTIINYVCYLGFAAHVAFIPLFFSISVPFLGWFNFLSAGAWLFAWWLNGRGRHWTALNLLTAEVVVHAVLAVLLLGWQSGFHTPLMPLITVIMINPRLKTRAMLTQALALVALYVLLYAFTKDIVPAGISPWMLEMMTYMHIGIVFAALCIVSYFYRQASIRAEKRMEQLATTDQLTGLANRRKMRELLDQETSRTERTTRPFALVLGDVDLFKKINDTFGHDFGDYVLRTVSDVLRESAREHDSVARWGGEEFLILLPETEFRGALDAAERLRAAVEQQPFSHEGESFEVTMTFGVAVYALGEDIAETMKRADRALYEGKHSGRNRVVAHLVDVDGRQTSAREAV
ncbi:MAG TPA: GGDEF domain-containing protein [Thermoanaerobaculia bacterium]|nr:GGDEF domain-containing protein [Thermoanaerobaculia bacterium]